MGRRTEKTVNGQTTGFLYDGVQAIAELKGGSIDTVYHTGVQIDEVLARYAPTGNKTLLTDALMSVIAQANDARGIDNFYAYSAYGEATSLGPDGGNALQYTGRENDATGLYYYRARYYDPILKQWISEDPIGLAGGINQRAYTNGAPTIYADPLGLDVTIGYYRGAGTAGHVGIGVNSQSTEGYYPTPGGSVTAPLTGTEGMVSPDDPSKLIERILIRTTASQDAAIQACIARRRVSPGNYSLLGNNCTDFVRECLNEARISGSPTGPGPRPLFESMRGLAQ